MEKVQYIGQQEVSEYNEVEGKVKYTLSDSSGATVTKEQFESMVRDTPYDDGLVRIYKWNPAVREIMGILLKNDMTILEKDFVSGRVDSTIIENYGAAAAKLFGTDYEHNITLSMIDKALQPDKKSVVNPTE